ncbi:hypothetical protein ACQ4PT_040822 [Festuca glaucescens]
MSSEEYLSESAGNSHHSETSDELEAELARTDTSSSAPEAGTGGGQEASSSGQSSGANQVVITRGAWKGSDVKQPEIDWLYKSRRLPAQVSCRIPRNEVEPAPEPGECVVFSAHFERGFGLPASDFFREFLDFYQLQPHHLPGNAIFYLSCFVSFMEAYVGLLPTKEAFARFFCLRINSVQGKNIPRPKPPVQCGSCIISARQGSPFFQLSGLESCRAWQETFFYVKNKGAADFINLPVFLPGTPSRANWKFNPGTNHTETNRIVRFLEELKRDTDICSDDIIRAFVSRRVLPLQRRVHKMSQMCGRRDPTKITSCPLSKEDVALKVRQISRTDMPPDWEWGFRPLSSLNPPTENARRRFPRIAAEAQGPCLKRALDEEDPDPYVVGKKHKMGRTHTSRPDLSSASTNPQVVERATPLQAEVGEEFLEKLASRGQKRKAPAPEAGSSDAAPATRSRKEVVGGKMVTAKCYRKREMPVASGPALKTARSATGMRPEISEDAARASSPSRPSPVPSGTGNPSASPLGGTTSAGRAAPEPADHRAEEDIVSPPEAQDIGTSNTGAGTEDAGKAEPLVPPFPKKKIPTSFPSKTVQDSSTPASFVPAKDLSEAPARSRATSTPPPAASTGERAAVVTAASVPSSDSRSSVLHAGRAAIVAGGTASAQVGRITELTRGGADLGHLLDYAEKWNRADLSPATRGLGKDKLPIVDPSGPRSTAQHLSQLKRAVQEFDTVWHDANGNVVSTLDTRKQLFEELLWEHRELSEAHSKCQALPAASVEALTAQEKISAELKEKLVQIELRHALELKDAQAAAEAKLDESLKQYTDYNAVLRAELEEETVTRKAAQDRIATLTADQAEYDRLVVQTDALAFRLFPDSQAHAGKKVAERRAEQTMRNPDLPWDAYDHLVALSARIQHMRAVDRHLVDLSDRAMEIFKVLWPGEAVPANVTLISDRLKDACRRIREWKCSAARAGADAALRVACSWYEDLDLDAFHSLRGGTPTDMDPILTAKRQDRAYRIAQSVRTSTFIPPPADIEDEVSDDEEEGDSGAEDQGAEEGDAPPEQAPEASDANPQPPVA